MAPGLILGGCSLVDSWKSIFHFGNPTLRDLHKFTVTERKNTRIKNFKSKVVQKNSPGLDQKF